MTKRQTLQTFKYTPIETFQCVIVLYIKSKNPVHGYEVWSNPEFNPVYIKVYIYSLHLQFQKLHI